MQGSISAQRSIIFAALRCVDGSLLPKISELPGETSEAMWKRAIASSNWRFRVGRAAECIVEG